MVRAFRAYIQSDDSYFDMVTRQEIARNVFTPCFVTLTAVPSIIKTSCASSVYFDERRQDRGAPALLP